MEKGLQSDKAAESPATGESVFASASPAPLHTKTQSTLAPTAEFTRIFLLAWIIRYVFRGGSGLAFEEASKAPGWRNRILDTLSIPGRWLQKKLPGNIPLDQLEAASYATAIGIGSGWLSWRYSNMVKNDIQNIFSEAVAYEKDKSADQVTFNDIKASDNAIVKRTVANYREKFWGRIGTDGLFFGAAWLRKNNVTDFLLGLKGVQIFADTWKRKTTMFEDLITFINNKINPRNGLGQPISVGEVFDLYQHYSDGFDKNRMFTNVLERGTGEGQRWAQNQPIFDRITQLMNLTYAYKHPSVIDPKTGQAVHQADFALPKFIYLLGHDLIDVNKPQQTLATIEIANLHGIAAVKKMQHMLASGSSLEEVTKRFPIPAALTPAEKQKQDVKNGVIAKGSTMQLDTAEGGPATTVDTGSLLREQALGFNAPQVNTAPGM